MASERGPWRERRVKDWTRDWFGFRVRIWLGKIEEEEEWIGGVLARRKAR